MKIIFTLIVVLFSLQGAFAQSTASYTISSNKNWSAVLPGTCANCTITISTDATLTIDETVSCQNCTFQGGAISLGSYTLNIQLYNSTLVTTKFINTVLNVTGTGSVVANAPLSLSGTTFTFNNTSALQTSYEVDLSASRINLYDNSTMYSTGSSTTPINLVNSSQIVVGSGSKTSQASFTVSGPALTIYDKSSVTLGNNNNYLYNWANYTTLPNTNANSNAAKSYSTSSSTMNCNGSYPHACQSPYLYGPASLSSGGTTPGNALPVVLVNYTAILNSNGTVTLSWNTDQEVNSSHFDIERSQDGSDWTSIGTVEAKGNSSIVTDYSFTDETPAAAINYYRIKMVDLDGSYSYTEIKVLRSTSVAKISFFPNPAHDYVNVSLSEASGTTVTIRLFNLSGQILQERQVVSGSGTTVSFPLQQYASGMYILSVQGSDGSSQSSKIQVSRS